MCATSDLATLFGTPIAVARDPAPLPHVPLESHWARAYDQWLAELPAESTRRAYQRAWRDLLDFTGKPPWAIRADDARDWILDLSERPLHAAVAKGLRRKGARQGRFGYSPSTIRQYLAGVSSFYTFAIERYHVAGPDGRNRPLHLGLNPTQPVRRPKSRPFRKAGYLDATEMNAILVAIPKDTVQGLRDLALILGYMLTGRRNSEWRCLRWRDLDQRGDTVYHVWSGKGKEDERHQLPPPVWEAILNYLTAAGRLESISDDQFIFIPLNDRAKSLPNVSDKTWNCDRPLSRYQANRLLKKYARRARINPTPITVHTLRHSFAMLLDSLGVGVRTISKRLAHSDLKVTAVYLDHLKGVPDETWREAAAALKLDQIDAPAGAKQYR